VPPNRRRPRSRTAPRARPRKRPARRPRGGFVGRDPSPVLDRYPPRAPADGGRPIAPPRPVVAPSAAPAAPPATLPPTAPADAPTPRGLLSLERPFDVDEFAALLGSPAIRVDVPKEALAEVLRRITDFMGFGIYVYALSVRPGPDETLRRFVVELRRVDFSSAERRWVPFEEKGTVDSPFGPGGSG